MGGALKRNLVAMNEPKLVQHVIGNRPAVNDATVGADITSWRTNKEFSAPYAIVLIEGTVAATLTAPPSGAAVELFGYRTNFGWNRIGYLDDAQQIVIAADLIGYAQEIEVIGIFERLLVAATVSAGQATAKFAPLEYYT